MTRLLTEIKKYGFQTPKKIKKLPADKAFFYLSFLQKKYAASVKKEAQRFTVPLKTFILKKNYFNFFSTNSSCFLDFLSYFFKTNFSG